MNANRSNIPEEDIAPAPFRSEFVVSWLLAGPAIFKEVPRDALTRGEVARLGKFETNVGPLWREHEVWLRAAAQQRGIRPQWPGNKFYAEAVAAGERKGL